MNSTAWSVAPRAAAVLLGILLLTSFSPLRSEAGKGNPSRVPAEELPAVQTAGPDPPYENVDYLFPVSSVRHPRIYIYKSRRRLLVLEDDILIRDYPIGLGPFPVGDKRERGDGRTPEGEFFVCVKNPRSKYYRSVGLSYPGRRHAEQALRTGLLSYRDYQTILKAQARRQRPPWTTLLGGDICIHGGGAHEDWTKGCVALYDFDMNELFVMVRVGTPVYILP
jgi:hypothetical protein